MTDRITRDHAKGKKMASPRKPKNARKCANNDTSPEGFVKVSDLSDDKLDELAVAILWIANVIGNAPEKEEAP